MPYERTTTICATRNWKTVPAHAPIGDRVNNNTRKIRATREWRTAIDRQTEWSRRASPSLGKKRGVPAAFRPTKRSDERARGRASDGASDSVIRERTVARTTVDRQSAVAAPPPGEAPPGPVVKFPIIRVEFPVSSEKPSAFPPPATGFTRFPREPVRKIISTYTPPHCGCGRIRKFVGAALRGGRGATPEGLPTRVVVSKPEELVFHFEFSGHTIHTDYL